MVITQLEELEKTKVKVYIDNEYAFLLYQKDLKRFHLEPGAIIEENLYEEIIRDTILRRAKQKAIAILQFMDRSEEELRKKLREAEYLQPIIDMVVSYLYEYDYLNNERYATSYVRTRMNRKSKYVIRNELLQKGVKTELIDQVFANEYHDDNGEDEEMLALKRAILQKTKTPENLSYEEKQKLIASLYRKGFKIDKIKKALF